ncbi:hypothetical protein L3Q82_003285 [Scortum barcoo]|uniref:Uncharacterized protein n=1 Tax=Scortum barcoo TaxID=214431 RepID=A0ACB8VM05_9TELE|nr:hypothetical protein L3Q82_003285 [Scortum barcoo]
MTMRRPTREEEEAERGTRPPLHQRDYGGESQQQLQEFLGVHISEDLTWTHHTDFITKSARQQALLPPQAAGCGGGSTWTQHGYLCSFYRCTIERILTGCITAWYSSCTALNRKALQRVVKAAQHITRTELPSMEEPLHPAV